MLHLPRIPRRQIPESSLRKPVEAVRLAIPARIEIGQHAERKFTRWNLERFSLIVCPGKGLCLHIEDEGCFLLHAMTSVAFTENSIGCPFSSEVPRRHVAWFLWALRQEPCAPPSGRTMCPKASPGNDAGHPERKLRWPRW